MTNTPEPSNPHYGTFSDYFEARFGKPQKTPADQKQSDHTAQPIEITLFERENLDLYTAISIKDE